MAESIGRLDSVFKRLSTLRDFNIRVDACSKYVESFGHTQDLPYRSMIIVLQHMKMTYDLTWESRTARLL